MSRSATIRGATVAILAAVLATACGPRGGVASPPAGPTTAAVGSAAPDQSGGAVQPSAAGPELSGTLDVWTIPQGDDEKAIKAYGKAFEAAHPGVEVKILVVGEEALSRRSIPHCRPRRRRTSRSPRTAPGWRLARSSN